MKIKIISILLSVGFLTTSIINNCTERLGMTDHSIFSVKTCEDFDAFNVYISKLAKEAGLVFDQETRAIKITQDFSYQKRNFEEKIKKLKKFCQTHGEASLFYEEIRGYLPMPACLVFDEGKSQLMDSGYVEQKREIQDKFVHLLDGFSLNQNQKAILISLLKQMSYESFFAFIKEIEKINSTLKIDEDVLGELYQLFIQFLISNESYVIIKKMVKKQKWFKAEYKKIKQLRAHINTSIENKAFDEVENLVAHITKLICNFMIKEYEIFPCMKNFFAKYRVSQTHNKIEHIPHLFASEENFNNLPVEFHERLKIIIRTAFNHFFEDFQKI